jgi:nitrate reductase alpha subunit
VRYLTPHSKGSIHSEYEDNRLMLSLSQGGTTMWMSPADAEAIGAWGNDWVEAVNRNAMHKRAEGGIAVDDYELAVRPHALTVGLAGPVWS